VSRVSVDGFDVLEGNTANPEQHPIAIALRRQKRLFKRR